MVTRRTRTGARRTSSRRKMYQIGKSKTSIDKRFKAKHPGRRVSKNGNVYYEHRRNRSDINRNKNL